jgi:hypothetical protein
VVQYLKVSATVKPKNSFTSQKPASLTWERMSEPEQSAYHRSEANDDTDKTKYVTKALGKRHNRLTRIDPAGHGQAPRDEHESKKRMPFEPRYEQNQQNDPDEGCQ